MTSASSIALVALLVFLAVAPASADGPLRPGEAVGGRMDGTVLRFGEAPSPAASVLAQLPPIVEDLAIGSSRTIYSVAGGSLWKIDVRGPDVEEATGAAPTVDSLPMSIETGPGETLYVLWWNGVTPGLEITRLDPDGTSTLVATLSGSNVSYFTALGDGTFAVGPPTANGSAWDYAVFDPGDESLGTATFAIADLRDRRVDVGAGTAFEASGGLTMRYELWFELWNITDPVDQQELIDAYPNGVPTAAVLATDLVTGATSTAWLNEYFTPLVFGIADLALDGDLLGVVAPDTGADGFYQLLSMSSNTTSHGVATVGGGFTRLEFRRAACSNDVDDDGDGLLDSNDPDCTSPDDDWEATACTDGVDNDFDGDVDGLDSDCVDPRSDAEFPVCSNGLDDDGDGFTDRFDLDCASGLDDSELPLCADGVDNDFNGEVDFPDDPGCFIPADDCEGNVCAVRYPACMDFWDGDGDGWLDIEDPDCLGNMANPSELPACSDGIDNDADGSIDLSDSDCNELTGQGERAVCGDGVDNDGDGHTDFPYDIDCFALDDPSEIEECQDGLDNDGDGLVDFPADPDCTSATDPYEVTGGGGGAGCSGSGAVLMLGLLVLPWVRGSSTP